MTGDYFEPKNSAEYLKFYEENKAGSILVYLTATWCGPCRAIAPVFARLAAEHKNIKFVKVDVDLCGELPIVQGVQGVPTFIAYKSEVVVGQFAGANQNALNDLVKKL
ncbi:thioredoxin [Tieghemostelium lacteum]|uniref:Thioredoxin n=1 Tax=Tieghemostelium lacteum TaxID=361077 RepID=A0A151Z7U2_TIELA|nr:thioredoxin [Tieghemostelium lacteum]|eukprot:KYQ89998.1 thioredoxin [Tieghemostelium lacteum]